MALQKQVNLDYAHGVAGDVVNPLQVVYTPINMIAETEITVGNFCFEGTDKYKQVKNAGEVVKGFVQRVVNYPNYNLLSSGSLTVSAGSNMSVAVKGDFYAVSATAATVGQSVFASETDGSIKTGTASSTVSGYVETSWKVKKGGAIGELIVISNWE